MKVTHSRSEGNSGNPSRLSWAEESEVAEVAKKLEIEAKSSKSVGIVVGVNPENPSVKEVNIDPVKALAARPKTWTNVVKGN